MEPGSSLLSHRSSALSSALSGFTSEVGMGSGGSRLLWPPGKLVGTSHRSQYSLALHLETYTAALVSYTHTVWVLYGQASRAISTG